MVFSTNGCYYGVLNVLDPTIRYDSNGKVIGAIRRLPEATPPSEPSTTPYTYQRDDSNTSSQYRSQDYRTQAEEVVIVETVESTATSALEEDQEQFDRFNPPITYVSEPDPDQEYDPEPVIMQEPVLVPAGEPSPKVWSVPTIDDTEDHVHILEHVTPPVGNRDVQLLGRTRPAEENVILNAENTPLDAADNVPLKAENTPIQVDDLPLETNEPAPESVREQPDRNTPPPEEEPQVPHFDIAAVEKEVRELPSSDFAPEPIEDTIAKEKKEKDLDMAGSEADAALVTAVMEAEESDRLEKTVDLEEADEPPIKPVHEESTMEPASVEPPVEPLNVEPLDVEPINVEDVAEPENEPERNSTVETEADRELTADTEADRELAEGAEPDRELTADAEAVLPDEGILAGPPQTLETVPEPDPLPLSEEGSRDDHPIFVEDPDSEPQSFVLVADYMEATPLFKAIQRKNWHAVLFFLRTGSFSFSPFKGSGNMKAVEEQTQTWVAKRDESGNELWRQLPLHAAICFGASQKVVEKLMQAYPEALKNPDCHGNLPLHLAFIFDADDSVLALLMKTYPAALHVMNFQSLQPIQCSSEISSETFQYNSELFGALSDYTRAVAENDPEKLAEQLKEVRTQLKKVNDTLFAAATPRKPEAIKEFVKTSSNRSVVEYGPRAFIREIAAGLCPMIPMCDPLDDELPPQPKASSKASTTSTTGADRDFVVVDTPSTQYDPPACAPENQTCRVMEYCPKTKSWKEV